MQCNKNKEVNMTQEELKELENLLWKYKLKYAKELNKKELKSIIEDTDNQIK